MSSQNISQYLKGSIFTGGRGKKKSHKIMSLTKAHRFPEVIKPSNFFKWEKKKKNQKYNLVLSIICEFSLILKSD